VIDTGQVNSKGKPIRHLTPNPTEQKLIAEMRKLRAQQTGRYPK